MTPTHSGIDFGWIAASALRRRLWMAAAVVLAATAATTLLLAPASSTACLPLARATNAPDLRVTALPGVDLRPVLALAGLSAASGPYPGVATSIGRDGTEVSTWVEGRPARSTAVDTPFLVSGSWARRGGIVVEQGLARRLGLRTGERARVATARGTRGLRVAGIAATTSVARVPDTTGLAYVLPAQLPEIAPTPVHGSTVLLRTRGRDSGQLAASLHRRYPGPQAVIARSFSDRCLAR